MSRADWLVMGIAVALMLFSTFSALVLPAWSRRWKPARWIEHRAGAVGVRIFYLAISFCMAGVVLAMLLETRSIPPSE